MTSNTVGNLHQTIVFPNAKPKIVGRTTQRFMLAYAFLIAFPIFDLPGFGLSLTMPLMLGLFLELNFRSPHITTKPYKSWFIWCYMFAFVLCLSLVYNALFIPIVVDVTQRDIFNLAAFMFWMASFYALVIINSSYEQIMAKIVPVLGAGIIALGAVALSDYILGNMTMFPNDYGFQFTAYTAYAFYMAFIANKWRKFYLPGFLLLLVAIAINGSRTSFITAGVIALLSTVFMLIGTRNRPQILSRVVMAALVVVVILPNIPDSWVERIEQRVETMDHLENDKSFLIRLLMIQKAERLFAGSPVVGVGLGRFRYTSAVLDLPRELSYGTQEHFNEKSGHNAYLTLLAETGGAGMGLYVGLLAVLAVGGLLAVLKGLKRGDFFYIPIYVSFIAMSIHLWTLSGLTNSPTWFSYALVAAMIVRERLISDRLKAELKAEAKVKAEAG